MDFKQFCYCGFNLSNDDVISVLCKNVMSRFVTTFKPKKWDGF